MVLILGTTSNNTALTSILWLKTTIKLSCWCLKAAQLLDLHTTSRSCEPDLYSSFTTSNSTCNALHMDVWFFFFELTCLFSKPDKLSSCLCAKKWTIHSFRHVHQCVCQSVSICFTFSFGRDHRIRLLLENMGCWRWRQETDPSS